VLPTSQWPWWDRTYLVIGLNMGLSLLVTLLTPPDRRPILGRFFRAARPLGAWGPVRNRADREDTGQSDSGLRLILCGLVLALLGAASVMLMVVGLSILYVGCYGSGLGLLAGFALGTTAFFRAYGPYLTRLERRAPPQMSPDLEAASIATEDRTEPLATNYIVALATGGYGLMIGGGGLIWTRGEQLTLNLLAAGAFLVAAIAVGWLGRPASRIIS
jgi:hypothetical protein